MFHEADLIHADFSASNLLVFQDELFIIDLAQAVSKSHPNSTHFLRRDCYNITNFFRQNSIPTPCTRLESKNIFIFLFIYLIGTFMSMSHSILNYANKSLIPFKKK